MRRRVDDEGCQSGVDMTPMLDIVFIMLIFFIVTASFVKDSGIKIDQPSAKTAQGSEHKGPIIVTIDTNGDIWLDKRRYEIRLLTQAIASLHKLSPQRDAIIEVDKRSYSGRLVEVMDAIRLGGVDSILVGAKKR